MLLSSKRCVRASLCADARMCDADPNDGHQETNPLDIPLANSIQRKVVIYDRIRQICGARSESRDELMDEIHHFLLNGPGVFVVTKCVPDVEIIERAERTFQKIIGGGEEVDGREGRSFRAWRSQ
jgi:hypothetical protein